METRRCRYKRLIPRFIFLSAVFVIYEKSRCVVYSWFDIQEQTAHTSSSRHWEEKPPVGAAESLSGMLFLCPAPSLLSLFQMYFLLPADRSLLLTRPSSRCVSGITSMQNEPFCFCSFFSCFYRNFNQIWGLNDLQIIQTVSAFHIGGLLGTLLYNVPICVIFKTSFPH